MGTSPEFPSDNHTWLIPAGNIGEKCSVGGITLVRTAHPTAGGTVLLGMLPFCMPVLQPYGLQTAVWTLPAQDRGAELKRKKLAGWIERAVGCAMRTMFFYAIEFEFDNHTWLMLLLDRGVINPTLLTVDASLRRRIQGQPLLQWKAFSVRRHKGLS